MPPKQKPASINASKWPMRDSLKVDRIPPSSSEAEAAALGCILLNFRALSEAQVVIRSKEYFYEQRHQNLWDILTTMSHSIDKVTVFSEIHDRNAAQAVGGLDYVAGIADTAMEILLPDYLEIIRKKFILRQIVHKCAELTDRAFKHDGDIEPLLADMEKDVLAIRGGMNCGGVADVAGTLDALACKIQEASDGGTPIGMQTGIKVIDRHIGGMRAQVIGVSGEPSTGKTSLASQIGLNRVFNHGDAVGWFSLETDAETMLTRFICNRHRINSRNLFSNPSAEELRLFGRGKMELLAHRDKIMICDDSDLTMSQIRSRARRMVQQGAKLIVIDFLQIVKHKDAKKGKTDVVAEAAYEVKAMVKELKVPVIVICTLSNEGALKNSGDINYALDVHIALKKSKDSADEDKRWTVICRFAKGKDCGTATKALEFVRPYYRFEDAEEQE